MKATCKPGGCSSLGCEGGYYCFTPDGVPKTMSPEKQEELRHALDGIFSKKEGQPDFGKAPTQPCPEVQALGQKLYNQLSDPKSRINPRASREEIELQIKQDIAQERKRREEQHDKLFIRGGMAALFVVLVIAPLVIWILAH